MKVYVTDNKETYEKLRQMLSGIAFFRNDNNQYFIKVPKNPVVENFLTLGLISEYSEIKDSIL